jgi:hypothetical protein
LKANGPDPSQEFRRNARRDCASGVQKLTEVNREIILLKEIGD